MLWIVGSLALLVTVAVTNSEAVIPHDEEAFVELVDRLEAGEQSEWLATFAFERTLPDGRTTGAELTEGQAGGLHVVRDPTSATAETDDSAFTCVITDDSVECLEQEPTDALRLSAIVQAAVDAGAYTVIRLPSEEIAGESADCYRVFAARGYLPALGAETRICVTPDGIPVSTRVVTFASTDERIATEVVRDPDRSMLEDLVADLEQAAEEAAPQAEG